MYNLHNNLLHSFWYCQYTGNWIREEMTYLYLYNYQMKWVTFKSQWGELISKDLILSHYLREFMIIFMYFRYCNFLFSLKAVFHLAFSTIWVYSMWSLLAFLHLCIYSFIKYGRYRNTISCVLITYLLLFLNHYSNCIYILKVSTKSHSLSGSFLSYCSFCFLFIFHLELFLCGWCIFHSFQVSWLLFLLLLPFSCRISNTRSRVREPVLY